MEPKYFSELARRLNEQQIRTGPPHDNSLPVVFDRQEILLITQTGTIMRAESGEECESAKKLFPKVRQTASLVHEYITAMEQAVPLKAEEVDTSYRQLAEFNDTVLAGQTAEGGIRFAVLDWNAEHTALCHGEYYMDNYEQAKQNFAIRAGLIKSENRFSSQQLAEMYRCVEDTLAAPDAISSQRRKLLARALEQIQEEVPNLNEMIQKSCQADLSAVQPEPASSYRNAWMEKFEHIELLGKPALLTCNRINRATVPEGWSCYELRGADCDLSEPISVERCVRVNFAGTVLMPDEIELEQDTYRMLDDGLNCIEGGMTLAEFCEGHPLNQNPPQEEPLLHMNL